MQRINEKQLTQHYLSHDIQNELIALMSKSVIEEIIHRVKQAKYYAFLLNCTRDISRVEQMSIILRFCNSSTGAIEEHFVGFIDLTETMGEYITNSILQELERNGPDIQNCRGQGYANSSATAKTFFGFINKIYLLFSKSSKRWDIVKTKLKLTLKPLFETRWESRIGAVKAIFLQFDDISKLRQSVQVNLKVAIDTLRSFCSWIQEFRNNTGFDTSVAQALLFVEKSSFEIESQFKEKRTARKKRMFDYEHTDEPIQSFEMQYRVNFFNTMIDAIIVEKTATYSLSNYMKNSNF
ncbi:zinc finger MYM-type protein 1 [Trichonephila clavipes]|nr:zinc finger MYM-type protein 1 [Trichonephila clavipes]